MSYVVAYTNPSYDGSWLCTAFKLFDTIEDAKEWIGKEKRGWNFGIFKFVERVK